jgi:hypothetical protein
MRPSSRPRSLSRYDPLQESIKRDSGHDYHERSSRSPRRRFSMSIDGGSPGRRPYSSYQRDAYPRSPEFSAAGPSQPRESRPPPNGPASMYLDAKSQEKEREREKEREKVPEKQPPEGPRQLMGRPQPYRSQSRSQGAPPSREPTLNQKSWPQIAAPQPSAPMPPPPSVRSMNVAGPSQLNQRPMPPPSMALNYDAPYENPMKS